ncbi:5'-methylthioadenosine/S-adenosylhomocysteine nucleosidase [Catenovulum agarivorans DS-2]|uniref:5'-methylthioadenosine/S-adenosylhomocysteine nucleosidase n=1 Tax=Catenovulum agarivorans DS-2 TaxID=1328313 RepID=W7QS92_9ALTE|nr:5'-methylthioadenosine/S-adenosylhomocysteine nucleosidase [Catenovulum agarivorans]EWH11882.1 5'-methylthioadenosine/S-adenosylhomocysteine nucleosidase [Catenovulum agarivorans DS-2]
MKIGIIGAMAQEVAILLAQMENKIAEQHGPCTIYSGILANKNVVLVQSGVGKTAAAMSTTMLLDNHKPDVVLNTGSAGGFAADLDVGDLVISNEVRHHDVDLTAFGFEIGQGYGFPAAFVSEPTLVERAQAAAALQHDLQAKVGLICSGDSFMACPEKVALARENFPNMIAVEMEAAAIAQVCAQFNTPFVVVRALSDIAGKSSHQSFETFLQQAAKHSSQLVCDFIRLC